MLIGRKAHLLNYILFKSIVSDGLNFRNDIKYENLKFSHLSVLNVIFVKP